MKLSEILYPGEYVSEWNAEKIEFGRIVSSTEETLENNLFICIKGTRFDSHYCLSAVAASGAAAAIAQRGAIVETPPSLPVFFVEDTRLIYALLWSRTCDSPGDRLHLIGVTGTNGKTSTSHMLRAILEHHGYKTGIVGTAGCATQKTSFLPDGEFGKTASMTTPDPEILYPMLRAMADDGVEYVILEASSHALELRKLAPLHFDAAIFTGLSPEHLDFHQTMENYLAAKAHLFRMSDVGIINADSEYAEKLAAMATCPCISCGAVYAAEIQAREIDYCLSLAVAYTYTHGKECVEISVPIPGIFTVYNSLLAIACAEAIGIPAAEGGAALEKIAPIPGRLERLKLDSLDCGFAIYIDYAHTPAAMENVLASAIRFKGSGRLIVLFGCGGDRDHGKRAPMGAVAAKYADLVIITSDNPRSENPQRIIMNILAGIPAEKQSTVIVNRERAIRHAIHIAESGDTVLLIGKGHEQYEINQSGKHYFSERAIVLDQLKKRKKNMEQSSHESGL